MLVGSTVKVKGSRQKELTVLEKNGDKVVCGWHEKGVFMKKEYEVEELTILAPPGVISSIF
ncbi:hypothetical protein F3J41_22210 [Pantoea sp. Ap-870]|uniref:hypothetical protein n=1 Tax=Pantoea sp. Ap-870 TaxID=2608358 RepID=UPI001419C905|nr:hypothetical protein [Pantoea sp. Ap-870]NIE54741.1 hypothetical protein [Pantoea sp. Ap-870]